MSIGEERGKLQAAVEKLNEAIGKLQGVTAVVEAATGLVSEVLDGDYANVALTEANGLIAESSMDCLDAGQAIVAAVNNLEGYIGRM